MRHKTILRFKDLLYWGDWHMPLNTALDRAFEGTESPRLKELITQLKSELKLHDECIHTITMNYRFPAEIDGRMFIKKLKESAPDSVTLELVETSELLVSVTERGSLESVKADANEYFRRVKMKLNDFLNE